jgi:hypothetical protein
MCLLLGSLLAIAAHRQLMDSESALGNRWFRDAVLFAFLIFLPTGIFFYLQWPDWSWLYFHDPRDLGTVATGLVWAAYPVSVMLGFAVAATMVRGDSPRGALAVPIVSGIVLVAVTLATAKRFLRLTTFEEYSAFIFRPHADLPPIWSDPVWIVTMAGTGVFIFIPFIYLFVRNIREHGAGFLPPAKP